MRKFAFISGEGSTLYFGINLVKVEKERQDLLEQIRQQSGA